MFHRERLGRLCVVGSLCALTVALALGARVRDGTPQDVLRDFRQRSLTRAGTTTPEQARAEADLLLRTLAAAGPQSPASPGLITAAFTVLPRAGRDQEAIDLARLHFDLLPDPWWRETMANEAIGLRVKRSRDSGLPMPEDARQQCREDALRGLEGQPSAESLLLAGSFDKLAGIAPLMHVRASTMPTPEERRTELRALQRLFRAAHDAATAAGRRNPVAMDLFGVTKELHDDYMASTPAPRVDDYLDIVCVVPHVPGDSFSPDVFLNNTTYDRALPRRFRDDLVRAAPGRFSPAAVLRARYKLLAEDRAGLADGTALPAGVAADAELLLHDLHEFEATLDPSAPRPPGLNTAATLPLMIEQTLLTLWEVHWTRSHRCDLAAPAGREYLQRRADTPSAREITRILGNCH
ncbi:MAG: hypothetical protein IT433_00420 [Phycisphaerales bacterium]|nr:hypothetical protein [Phycisphaerales bacterium]